MTHLFEYKYWTIQIIAYLFFSVFTFFNMKAISVYYHSKFQNKTVQLSSKSLLILLFLSFYIVLVTFSSFRYIPQSVTEFNSLQDRHYCIGGNDTLEYRVLYNLTKGVDYFTAKDLTHKEYLFVFICWIFSNLGFTFDLFLTFFNTLLFFSLIAFCREFDLSKNSFLSIIALVALYLASFNTLRWSTTLLFSVYFAKYYIKQDLKKCFFVMLLCMGIQFSAVVYIMPIVGAKFLKKNKKIGVLFFIFCSFICYAPALLDIAPYLHLLGRRAGQTGVEGNTPTTWLLFFFIYTVNILFVRKTLFKNRKHVNIFYMVLFLMPPIFMELTFGLAYRFSYFGHPLLYVHTIYLRKENHKYGITGLLFTALEMVMLLTVILKFYYGVLIESTGVPYIFNKNFLWGA